MDKSEDRRPDPKPRKHPVLWQSYQWWDELMQMRKRHLLRIDSIEKGKSNLDAAFERHVMEAVDLDALICQAKKEMSIAGEAVGPIWDWMTAIKGIGDHTAAKILALFDDPGKFATASKFQRFAGWAVIDGEIDRCKKGQKSPYCRRLKSECFLLAESFIKQQTPVYVDDYYAEKERQRRLHPEPVESDGPWPKNFTDSHIHRRAMRHMIKLFLHHLWAKWRGFEGLPVSEPYVAAILGHTHIVPSPEPQL